MSVCVRAMRIEDARRFLEIQGAAVRGLAAKDYPPSVIEAWASPTTDPAMERFLANPDDEIRLIAEADGERVGIGGIVVAASELRACYVAPHAARRGVGTASPDAKTSMTPVTQKVGRCCCRDYGVPQLWAFPRFAIAGESSDVKFLDRHVHGRHRVSADDCHKEAAPRH